MRWLKKPCLLAIFVLLLVSVDLVSCTDQMADAVVDKFIDTIAGKKTTEKSDIDKPFSLTITVNVGVFDAKTKKAVYPCEINFSADQIIGQRDDSSSKLAKVLYGDRFTTNKQTDSEGWARTTFLFKRIYKSDQIQVDYKACGGDWEKVCGGGCQEVIDDMPVKLVKQISKDSFELTYNIQTFKTANQR
jgi:hypothetical protein